MKAAMPMAPKSMEPKIAAGVENMIAAWVLVADVSPID
jgi:hypothetical protein